MSYYCLNRNPDSDNETDYCNITKCPYMELIDEHKKLKFKFIEVQKDYIAIIDKIRKDIELESSIKDFIKECESSE